MTKQQEENDDLDQNFPDPDLGIKHPIIEMLEYGTIALRGPITDQSCSNISNYIISENYKQKLKSICLIIDSSGGSVDAAFALISIIKSSIIPIGAIAIGNCSSAALFIAMSCSKRIVDRNCSILSHQYSAGFGEALTKHEELIAKMQDFQLAAYKIERLYVEETGKDLKYIRKHLLRSHDVFLNAESAIEHGVFDGLLENNLEVLYHNVIPKK